MGTVANAPGHGRIRLRRAFKVAAWIAAVFPALPALAVLLLIVLANIDAGRRWIERAMAQVSGGTVVVSGLAGAFPQHVRADRIELRDGQGTWATLEDVHLDWTLSRLLQRVAQVDLLHVGRLELSRPPAAGPSGSGSAFEIHAPFPARLDVVRLEVIRADLGAAFAGVAASIKVEGYSRFTSLDAGSGALSIVRLDSPGTYTVAGDTDGSRVSARIALEEPANGLAASLAGLPAIGALSVRLELAGPLRAAAVQLALKAGPLQASASGTADLPGETGSLAVDASAPAMAPSDTLSWRGIALHAKVGGPLRAPSATGRLHIEALRAGPASAADIAADVSGDRGALALHAVVQGLRVPGPRPDLLADGPVELNANIDLAAADRPLRFSLSHALLSARGAARTQGRLDGTATISLPALAPLTALAGLREEGHATIEVHAAVGDTTSRFDLSGTVALSAGETPLPALIGQQGRFSAAITTSGEGFAIEQAHIDGAAAHASISGSHRNGGEDFAWQASIANLSLLSAQLSGQASGQGTLRGRDDSFALAATLQGEVASPGFPRGPVQIELQLDGLPGAPSGSIEATGSLNGAPLQLTAIARRDHGGTLTATIQRADWKSVHAQGGLRIPAGTQRLQGQVEMKVARLEDLEPFLGESVRGSLESSMDFAASPASGAGKAGEAHIDTEARIQIDVRDLAVAGVLAARVALRADVSNPVAGPRAVLQLAATGAEIGGVTGIDVNATGTLDVEASQLLLETADVRRDDNTIRLLAPARVHFADGVVLDNVRLGMQQAVLEVSGRVAPALDVSASLRNATAALVRAFAPAVDADGTLALKARLSGPYDAPRGRVQLDATGVRMHSPQADAFPAVDLGAVLDLDGTSVAVTVSATAGSRVRLSASGTAPLSMDGAIDLKVAGSADAALANLALEAGGRRVRGSVTLEALVGGTPRSPQVKGTLRLANGDFQDLVVGVHLSGVKLELQGTGDHLQLTSFSARAGEGTVTATGSIGLGAGFPVEITLKGRNAQPLSSDLLTADLDMDLRLRSRLGERIDIAGSIHVNRADINIASTFPPEVAVLEVRGVGQPPPAPRRLDLGFDIAVDAPRAVFVRGRGIEAEMGGKLHLGGTSAVPEITGGFDLRRGTVDLAGASLEFTTGKVSFNGSGVRNRIDPTLDFAAQKAVNGSTATLSVGGYADAPKVTVSSSPPMPQDEILARLIFGTGVTQLTPLQIAQMAAALATLTGSSGGIDPLAAVRRRLGLDRLSVGSGTAGSGASVEAGRYIANRVYVGAKETTTGTTQGELRLDLTQHLKLQAVVGNGTTTAQGVTPENDPGSSVGLTYQFEY
jgi:translocation and assembly module TamB